MTTQTQDLITAILPSNVTNVDYESTNQLITDAQGRETVQQRFFCVITVSDGQKFRHVRDITDELAASNMTDTIHTHLFNKQMPVNMEFWKLFTE